MRWGTVRVASSFFLLFVFAFVVIFMGGCPTRDIASVPEEGKGEASAVVEVRPNRDLDVLFVVDNSDSMGEEQTSLTENFDKFIDVLAGIEGGLPNVHIGVVSSDLGIGPRFSDEQCMGDGDSGILQNTPRGACTAPTDRFISDVASPAGREKNYSGTLKDTFRCIAKLGTTGCGFERHLDSMRRALSPSTVENAGFLRPGALLAVIVIGDEDDCSASDLGFYDPAKSLDDPTSSLGKILWRCTGFGVKCDDQPISRTAGSYENCAPDGTPENLDGRLYHPQVFVDALRATKANPELLFTAVIAGPVTPFVMGHKVAGDDDVQLLSSCPSASSGVAAPALRLKYFTDAFGSHGKFVSICDDDLSGALTSIASTLRALIVTSCLGGDIDTTDVSREPGLQPQCSVTDEVGGHETVIPRCQMTDATTPNTTTRPCWWASFDAAACPTSATHLELHVERGEADVPPDTTTKVRCATL